MLCSATLFISKHHFFCFLVLYTSHFTANVVGIWWKCSYWHLFWRSWRGGRGNLFCCFPFISFVLLFIHSNFFSSCSLFIFFSFFFFLAFTLVFPLSLHICLHIIFNYIGRKLIVVYFCFGCSLAQPGISWHWHWVRWIQTPRGAAGTLCTAPVATAPRPPHHPALRTPYTHIVSTHTIRTKITQLKPSHSLLKF